MDEAQKKEQFSKAYVRAIASVSGLRVSEPGVDDDSVDMTLAARGGSGAIRSAKLDLQLKCTATQPSPGEDLKHVLEIKNYDELRDDLVMVPRILVVVVVPKDIQNWLLHDETRLSLQHCAYWRSLRGLPSKPNQQSVTIRIPRSQHFNLAGVARIIDQISQGMGI